jgi:DNA repair proteins
LVILVYNYFFGVVEFSQVDEIIIICLWDVLVLVDIWVLDYLIVGDGSCALLVECGIL